MRDFAAIDENAYNLWSEYDALHAWNKHASRFAYLYQRCEELRDEDAPNQYAHGFDWYEEKYRKELEKAISDVCDALNADWDACRDWVDTRGFFEKEYLERDEDNEHWYTQDGKREFLRDARDNVWDHDTCEEMELIFSNRSPMRLYVRETIED